MMHAQASGPAPASGPGPAPSGAGQEAVVVAIAVGEGGSVSPRWGRAQRVGVATVHEGRLSNWEETEVAWDTLRDEGSERAHHARVARFVKQHGVQLVVAYHMGQDMLAMLERMGVQVQMPASDDAREAVLAAVGPHPSHAVEGPGRPGNEARGRP